MAQVTGTDRHTVHKGGGIVLPRVERLNVGERPGERGQRLQFDATTIGRGETSHGRGGDEAQGQTREMPGTCHHLHESCWLLAQKRSRTQDSKTQLLELEGGRYQAFWNGKMSYVELEIVLAGSLPPVAHTRDGSHA